MEARGSSWELVGEAKGVLWSDLGKARMLQEVIRRVVPRIGRACEERLRRLEQARGVRALVVAQQQMRGAQGGACRGPDLDARPRAVDGVRLPLRRVSVARVVILRPAPVAMVKFASIPAAALGGTTADLCEVRAVRLVEVCGRFEDEVGSPAHRLFELVESTRGTQAARKLEARPREDGHGVRGWLPVLDIVARVKVAAREVRTDVRAVGREGGCCAPHDWIGCASEIATSLSAKEEQRLAQRIRKIVVYPAS